MRVRPVALVLVALLLLLGVAGAPVTNAAVGASGAAAPAPTGRIAYVGTDGRLHVMNADGGGDLALATRGFPFTPRWSPTTGELVVQEQLSDSPKIWQLSVLDPATGVSRVLVPPEVRDPGPTGIEYFAYTFPNWTPDGSAVVYKKASLSRFNHAYLRVPASGGAPQELAGFGFFNATSVFDISPTDGRMALTENGLDADAGSSRLAVADLDGRNWRDILPYGGVFYAFPKWTADGRAIAVTQYTGGGATRGTLFLIDPGSGGQRVLGTVPAGSTYTFSPDGRWLLLATGDTNRLILVNLADLGDQRVIGAGRSPAWEAGRFFAETGFAVSGRFLRYWQQNGGLALYGYPLTAERRERLEDGREYTVQWFERARFEHHPENAPPNDVLLGQFGRRIHPADPPAAPQEGATYFAETGHNLSGRFLAYWQANGGLPQFGYPISEEFTEVLEDGRPYLVQYFERARFEYHPENQPPNDVLLGQFGRRLLDSR